MFKLKVHEGYRTGMVAICDVCGKEIHNAEGNILWRPKDKEKIDDLMGFKLAHKFRCTQVIDQEEGVHQYSQEIGVGLFYLLNNIGVNLKNTQRIAQILNSL